MQLLAPPKSLVIHTDLLPGTDVRGWKVVEQKADSASGTTTLILEPEDG